MIRLGLAALLICGHVLPAAAQPGDETLDLETIIARHVEARGGAERWRAVETLELSGTYAAFSERGPFTLIRQRGDRYRLDFPMLGKPATRAHDGDGPWWVHPLMGMEEPARLPEPLADYAPQLLREAYFGPLLLDYRAKDVEVALVGRGDLDGRAVYELDVTLPDDRSETWHLDAETFLEVAVDAMVHDFTQAREAMPQRTFFSDYRTVEGLVLPHRVEIEFGARLEIMDVERVIVDPPLDESRFRLPVPP